MRVICGSLKGKKLLAADADITRPTADRAKEGLFNILQNILLKEERKWQEITFVDVFAGSGAIGIEAFSRGSKSVFLFEKDKTALSFLKKNTKDLPIRIISGDACFPPVTAKAVDMIFFDPPYGQNLWEKALPNFVKQKWIGENTLIIVETDKVLESAIPAGFCLIREQVYSRNKFLFLKKDSE